MSAANMNAAPRSYFITANSYSDTKGVDTISFASNAYSIVLQFSNIGNFETAFPTHSVKMRSSVTDVTGRVLYDEYNLTFKYVCWADVLSWTSYEPDQIY